MMDVNCFKEINDTYGHGAGDRAIQEIGHILSGALVARKRQRFSALAASLDAMSPLKVLGRGYAMAQNKDGQILKSYQDVTAGDRVSVTLGEGGFTCTVDRPFEEVTRT